MKHWQLNCWFEVGVKIAEPSQFLNLETTVIQVPRTTDSELERCMWGFYREIKFGILSRSAFEAEGEEVALVVEAECRAVTRS